ncbi:MAG TPA: helicase-related protein [Ktedonobacteraceae bacterium]|nr:helicase-related protein [Ktedonobacteraceae bacterium]
MKEPFSDSAAFHTRDTFAEDMGRLFEIGFNTGILAAIHRQTNIPTYFGDLYRQDLAALHFQPLYTKLCERSGVISTWDKETLERWVLFLLQRGYLGGLNFFTEYIESFSNEKPLRPRSIVYLQCNFYGQNSLETYHKNERTAAHELMEQFRTQGYPVSLTEEDIREYTGKGNFLRADLLLLLRYAKKWRILSVDISVFALSSLQDAGDLASIEKIRQILATDIHYMRSKSVFTNLDIDTDAETASSEVLSGKLRHYFTAFKRNDKESVKLIQAASYAHSFYEFLKRQKILSEQDEVVFNVVGYTDRGISTISAKKEQLSVLETCADIYKSALTWQAINDERTHVLDTITKAAARGFHDGRRFVNKLIHLIDEGDGTHWLTHQETIDNFVNTQAPLAPDLITAEIRGQLQPEEYEGRSIQYIHGQLTKQELAGSTPYLFLTGNPGIGKTTAVVQFLKERSMRGEGFLFLYVSPRKQVNLDIIKKFREDEFGLHCDNLLALTANSIIIRSNQTKPTVHYYSKKRQDRFHEHGVDFIFMESEEAERQRASQRKLEEIQEGLLIDKGERISGVLDSLCSALYAAIDKPLSNAIVATVAIQSLKRTHHGTNTTLRHLEKIFQGTRSKGKGVDSAQMQAIGQRIQHIFVMIDEVTGDESGVEFIEGIHSFLHNFELLPSGSKYGINTKIIVADASIVDPRIITQHLSETTYEPDKIYFRRVTSQGNAMPVSRKDFVFKHLPAVTINTNAYPASSLQVTYNIGVDALEYDEETYTERSKQLHNEVQQRIIRDILSIIDQPDAPQLLVYIQDKQRLAALIQTIRQLRGTFQRNTDYVEIHANISEEERKSIEKYQDTTNVVFMTASASRGLSFKRAKHILIEIPRFEVEQNLMEILQVIYRGRGGELDQEEKTLTFYLAERVIYADQTDRALSVRESMLHLLNVLIILKTSMMTRIVGSGEIGLKQQFMMIPIGGKSVLAAGDSLTSRMGKLIKDLQDLSHRYWDDKRLNVVAARLTEVLSKARIRLLPMQQAEKDALMKQSYIPCVPTFSHTFHEAARKGFVHLLDMPQMEQAYIAGGLLVVPIQNHAIQEAYWIDIEHTLAQQGVEFDLLHDIEQLSYDTRYPDGDRMLLKDAKKFLEQLKKMAVGKTSYYEQETDHIDQHYAIPLLAFIAHKEMKAYFESEPEDEESPVGPFHALLSNYVRTLYPADSILPIGKNYDDFPFVIFRSFNLREARRKMFTDKYLFMSHELNILNMLLASKEE